MTRTAVSFLWGLAGLPGAELGGGPELQRCSALADSRIFWGKDGVVLGSLGLLRRMVGNRCVSDETASLRKLIKPNAIIDLSLSHICAVPLARVQ